RIRKVDAATGIITTVAGDGIRGFSGDGGPATAAQISGPYDVAVDRAGNFFIVDTGNDRIRRVDAAAGTITTVAGGGRGGLGDGEPATAAWLVSPLGIAVDDADNLSIADVCAARIRRVETSCGNGVVDPFEQCDDGAANGTTASCCAPNCRFYGPGAPCPGGVCDGVGHCGPIITTTTSTSTTTTTTMLPTSCGDVNGDSVVNIGDALIV